MANSGTEIAPLGLELPDQATLRTVVELWDELADFSATESEKARRHLMLSIARMVDANNAVWLGVIRIADNRPGDPALGWRLGKVYHLYENEQIRQAQAEQSAMLEAGTVDATVYANISGSGRYRVNSLADLVAPQWFRGDYYRRYYHGTNRSDAIWVGIPVNDDTESYFAFYRGADQKPFSEADKARIAFALRGLRWFHRSQFLSEGLGVASEPLTPLERRVLHGLLEGHPYKRIALLLERSEHTTREYVQRVLRKFGVANRSALMALWLGIS